MSSWGADPIFLLDDEEQAQDMEYESEVWQSMMQSLSNPAFVEDSASSDNQKASPPKQKTRFLKDSDFFENDDEEIFEKDQEMFDSLEESQVDSSENVERQSQQPPQQTSNPSAEDKERKGAECEEKRGEEEVEGEDVERKEEEQRGEEEERGKEKGSSSEEEDEGDGEEDEEEDEDEDEEMDEEEAEEREKWTRALKTELSGGPGGVNLHYLKDYCRALKFDIPPELRPTIWKHFCGVNNQSSRISNWEGEVDSEEYTALASACDNTRPDHAFFQDKETKYMMKRILVYYCEQHSIEFCKGLNEILAPFLLIGLHEEGIYNCFSAFLAKHLPNLANANDTTEGCLDQLVRLLVLYHDVELCHCLDQKFNLNPRQLTSQWFRTCFAGICSIDAILYLWDCLLVVGDPFGHYFFALALFLSKRKEILSAKGRVEIVNLFDDLHISSKKDVIKYLKQAQIYERNTPKSFRHQLYAVTYHNKVSWIEAYLSRKSNLPTCLKVSVSDVVQASFCTSKRGIKFFVIDCRPEEQFSNGRLPTAYHLPPRLVLSNPKKFRDLLNKLEPLKGLHFALMGPGVTETESYLEVVVIQFLEKNFNHISVVKGGYESLHALVFSEDAEGLELSDHNPDKCLVCFHSNTRPTQKVKKSETASMPSITPMFSKVGSSLASSVTALKDKSTKMELSGHHPTFGLTNSLHSLTSSISTISSKIIRTNHTQSNEENITPVFKISEEAGVEPPTQSKPQQQNQHKEKQTKTTNANDHSPSPFSSFPSVFGSKPPPSDTPPHPGTTEAKGYISPRIANQFSGFFTWGGSKEPKEEGEPESKKVETKKTENSEQHNTQPRAPLVDVQKTKQAIHHFFFGFNDAPDHKKRVYTRRWLEVDELIRENTGWKFYVCKKVVYETKCALPAYIVITQNQFLELEVDLNASHMARFTSCHVLTNLQTVTFKKNNSKLLTFTFLVPKPMKEQTQLKQESQQATTNTDTKGDDKESGDGKEEKENEDKKKQESEASDESENKDGADSKQLEKSNENSNADANAKNNPAPDKIVLHFYVENAPELLRTI
eukprot:CAMPEP_0174276142 /NCGR_PEP_ID=MMETSP0439-20130205/60218_1 /TAXON_ID=0 /ORGANISM="Stereomyxa ramosa, Strain Chinc5" /LENGTH=1059 /DNA_ID=CAMNT_0015368331 /DNA_START=3030 /DNA_END=6206 /DNA_ORIENTATION=+